MSTQQDSCISVRSVFEVERRLSAPLYQRRYSWSKRHLDDFWDDIRQVEEGESEALFLGAIILKHERPSNPSSGRLEELLLLDGQQRIATLYLTLLAIGLEWQAHGCMNEALAIAENYLMSTRSMTRGKSRFYPTIPDQPEFFSLCRKLKVEWHTDVQPDTYRPGKMSTALDRAQSEVHDRCDGPDGFNVQLLRKLEQTVVDKIEMVDINIAERHQANEVFDRLNRKGQPLTVGDLVKNEIFRRLAADTKTAMQLYREHWEPFERSFADQTQLDNYYYPFTLTIDDNATVTKAFQVLSRHWDSLIQEDHESATAAELIIEALNQYVYEYNALSAGSHYSDTLEMNKWVERFHRMSVPRVTYAFLFQLLRSERRGDLSTSAANECLRIVESFLVRRAFSGREPTGLHAVFKSLWRKNGGEPTSLVSDLQTRTIDFPDDEQLLYDISNKPLYGRRLDKYILSELEIATHRKGGANPFTSEQLQSITVDHLAPQSLKGDWSDEFPNDGEERRRLLGLLGNLIPLSQSDNSTKGAANWDVARSRLRNETIYRSAREVLDQYATWGPTQIKERTELLAHKAVERWPRPT